MFNDLSIWACNIYLEKEKEGKVIYHQYIGKIKQGLISSQIILSTLEY